jgi:hypothetical protein
MLGGGSAVLHQGPAKWAMRSTRAIRGPPLRENDGCTVIRTMILRSIEAFQSLFFFQDHEPSNPNRGVR